MADAANLFDRRVVGSLAVLVAFAIAGGLLAFGPGRSALETARRDADAKQSRIAEWRERADFSSGVSDDERVAWQRQYERFAAFGVSGRDEASVTQHIAGLMSAASLRGLELNPLAEDTVADEDSLTLREPLGAREVVLTRQPMRVRFDVEYRDLFPILERLRSPESGLVLTRAQFRRHFPGVRVDLDVDVWVRREVTS